MIDSPFDKYIAFSVRSGKCDVTVLHPEELRLISPSAVEKRRNEFCLGRAAAHAAIMALLGTSDVPILKGKHGEPVWPAGIVGAIAHTTDIAVAAAGRTQHTNGIGIDIEHIQRDISLEISREICTPCEKRWVEERTGEEHLRLVKIFSAKESIFKAFYPSAGEYLGFRDAEVVWYPATHQFHGRLLRSIGRYYPVGYGFNVGCRIHGDYVFTFMCLPPI